MFDIEKVSYILGGVTVGAAVGYLLYPHLNKSTNARNDTVPQPLRLYMKRGCPWCTKLAVWLADANLVDKVVFEWDTAENRAYVQEKCGKTTFPALEYVPGKVMLESSDIINHFAKQYGIDTARLSVYQYTFGDPKENGNRTFMSTYLKYSKYGKKQAGGFAELMLAAGVVDTDGKSIL